MMDILKSHLSDIIILLAWIMTVYIIRKIGKRLESVRKTSFLKSYLVEIGSDVRIYGGLSISCLYLGIFINKYFKGFSPYFLKISSFIILVWLLLLVIALAVQIEEYCKIYITESTMLEIDKRNFLTLIPVVVSIAKILIYIIFVIAFLAILEVDVSPLINIGGIILAALTFAGADTIRSVIFTLKIFLTRKFYVGSRVKMNGNIRGVVTRITIIDTTILSDDGYFQIIDNDKIVTIFVYPESTN
jgi:small-conductance mechanosensitive channel